MTKEEAYKTVNDFIINTGRTIEGLKASHALYILAHSGKDPDTGLVPCGNSKAVIKATDDGKYFINAGNISLMGCFSDKEAAINRWNKSMGCDE